VSRTGRARTSRPLELAVEKKDKQYDKPYAGSSYADHDEPTVVDLVTYVPGGLREESIPLRVMLRNVVRVRD
jgi:hypothetical protein